MFKKILIANRGEIACRIIKTAQSMGIHCVAIYSVADRESLHIKMADSAYCIGEAPAKDSYLNIEKIIDVAKKSAAEAIHPGYGFLSENPAFVLACNTANITFIGPGVEAMEAMASKKIAKQRLEKTNVPLTPGYHGNDQSDHELLKQAQRIGFPVLLKAANGGGGKGMRAVHSAPDFMLALAGARRESMASFADDTMIIEKLVLNPRHVELQIMMDTKGQVVHLFERDCSIQRRHQKIIEEAPAPDLSPTLRKKLANAACEVARSIHYLGAGTVEFLVDDHEQFYFMEMNTRLQVEHPVTEKITGLDLVAWQIKIAAGEDLPCQQEEIHQNGHAIECRIYAEDPYHDFMPSIGQITYLKEPIGDGIRIDTGITQGSQITMYYDPMIAKLVTWGDTRENALQRMVQALNHYHVGGVKTNIPFLLTICQHEQFKKTKLSTNFLDHEIITLPIPEQHHALLIAVSFDYLHLMTNTKDPLLQDTFSWKQNGLNHWTWRYLHAEQRIEARLFPLNATTFRVQLNENEATVQCKNLGQEIMVEINNRLYKAPVVGNESHITLYTNQGEVIIKRFNWNTLDRDTTSHKGQLMAPMPSTIVAILKQIGDPVKAGERLMILEAMKMEHTIHAPEDGVLLDVFYTVGSQVNEGAELLSVGASNNNSPNE